MSLKHCKAKVGVGRKNCSHGSSVSRGADPRRAPRPDPRAGPRPDPRQKISGPLVPEIFGRGSGRPWLTLLPRLQFFLPTPPFALQCIPNLYYFGKPSYIHLCSSFACKIFINSWEDIEVYIKSTITYKVPPLSSRDFLAIALNLQTQQRGSFVPSKPFASSLCSSFSGPPSFSTFPPTTCLPSKSSAQ